MFKVTVNLDGLDKLKKKVEEISKEDRVAFKDLFTEDFFKKNTKFSNIDDMFAKSGFVVNSQEDFQKIPDAEWDKFIVLNTNFDSWREMLTAAGKEWTAQKILG